MIKRYYSYGVAQVLDKDKDMYNEPSHPAVSRNRFLRMFRTELRSRSRLVLRQAPRCCKPILAYQGGYVDSGHGESKVRRGKARTCSQQLQVVITPKGSGLRVCTAICQTKWYPYGQPLRYHRARPLVTSFYITPPLDTASVCWRTDPLTKLLSPPRYLPDLPYTTLRLLSLLT